MVYRQDKPLLMLEEHSKNRKSLACGSQFTNSSRVLPTSRVVYQPLYRYDPARTLIGQKPMFYRV